MPELPDIELYVALLRKRLVDRRLISLRVFNPFVLRSYSPLPSELEGQTVVGLRRLGKRAVIGFSEELFVIVHLMIAGRFRWVDGPPSDMRLGGKIAIAALAFENGTLFLTEAGSKKRASITIVRGEADLAAHDPGGIDPLGCTLSEFEAILTKENHSIKDALTTPQLFSGIGNAYSDEILHAARIAPHLRTNKLTTEEMQCLFNATREVPTTWNRRLQAEFGDRFPGPGDITAFRPDFAVHGKFGKPCPVCGRPVQRIVYAENEANYCAECQNGGRILADRALSRLLKDDWPRHF